MRALLVDIGNSRIKWRVADIAEDVDSRSPSWQGAEHAVASNDADKLAAQWRPIASQPIGAAFFCNVADTACTVRVAAAITATWPGVAIRHVRATAAQSGVVNGYRVPTQLGADRWLAAIGGHRLHSDRTLLVCSFGTATTIDLVRVGSPGRAGALFIGGLILPGLETMRKSLAAGTAQLPFADGAVVDFADRTEDAIASGVIAAQVGAVERSLRAARTSAAASLSAYPLLCLLTGGAAPAVERFITDIGVPTSHVPGLVLHGLATVASETVDVAHHPG